MSPLWLPAVAAVAYAAGRYQRMKSEREVNDLIRRSIEDIGKVVAKHLHKMQTKEPG